MMLPRQTSLSFSVYSDLYDKLIPRDNKLHQLNDLVDFTFVYDELSSRYCQTNGRVAIDPVRVFKYLLLKVIFDLSDVDVVDRSRYDLSFKYFLDLAPEDDVLDASTLTRFRRQRLKDMNLLDLLVSKTVSLVRSRGVLEGKAIILDATHTLSRYNLYSARVALQGRLRHLQSTIRQAPLPAGEINDILSTVSPGETLEQTRAACTSLVQRVRSHGGLSSLPLVNERVNLLEETLEDVKDSVSFSVDKEARVGHKAVNKSFFGYKTHVAMTSNGIITAALVTTGEKADGQYLEPLVERSVENGMEVDTVIGDMAYSGRDNIMYATGHDVQLVSRLNPVLDGVRGETEFVYNKDEAMMVCPAGHLAYKERYLKPEGNKNARRVYFFDVKRCKECPLSEGCYKEGARKKTFSVMIKSDEHVEQRKFQETGVFRANARLRPRVEAKFAQLKNVFGYDRAVSCGLDCMSMQGAITIFAANML